MNVPEVTNAKYTPYGELWEEQKSDVFDRIPFRFTAKELDAETSLYYYGARYLDPRTSRWISVDPAGIELINPMDDEGKPKRGYSLIEATNWYSYVSNNPVKFIDPTGKREIIFDDLNGEPVFKDQLTSRSSKMPMQDFEVTATFKDHTGWGSRSPGTDLLSNNKTVSTTSNGILTYDDSGDAGYGFHAELTYLGKDGDVITDTFAHLERPENAQELIDNGPSLVKAGTKVGEMGNTGRVFTTAGGTQSLAPVTAEQRGQGWGGHLHWDKTVDGTYKDPMDE